MEPLRNKSPCNKVINITNNFLYPSNSKIMYKSETQYNETSMQRTNFVSPLALHYNESLLWSGLFCLLLPINHLYSLWDLMLAKYHSFLTNKIMFSQVLLLRLKNNQINFEKLFSWTVFKTLMKI